MRHAFTTRLLHLLLAGGIVLQLADSQLMRVPRPGRELTALQGSAFAVHQWVGLAMAVVIVLFWLWLTLRRVGTAPGQLFPWFSARRLRAVRTDLAGYARAATRLSLPDPETSGALAGALHGLGLLIALAMAPTGTIGWLAWDQSAAMSSFAPGVFEVHGAIANLMWAYVIAHVGATVLHELVGHRLLRRMAPLPS
ncbi:MAG: cytochrome b/b6 domain-containing protein [Geminicoccaceae bacterium]